MPKMIKLIGKTREEIIDIMGNHYEEESGCICLVYPIKYFFFVTKKIYIEFNDQGVADTVYTC